MRIPSTIIMSDIFLSLNWNGQEIKSIQQLWMILILFPKKDDFSSHSKKSVKYRNKTMMITINEERERQDNGTSSNNNNNNCNNINSNNNKNDKNNNKHHEGVQLIIIKNNDCQNLHYDNKR